MYLREVSSRWQYARGYIAYYSGHDHLAAQRFLSSHRLDANFTRPLEDLVAFASESYEPYWLVPSLFERIEIAHKAELYTLAAELVYDLGDETRSDEYRRRAIELGAPATTRLSLANSLLEQGKLDEASNVIFDAPQSLWNSSEASTMGLMQSWIFFERGYFEQALLTLDNHWHDLIFQPEALVLAGKIRLAMGEYSVARENLVDALKLQAALPEAYIALAGLNIETGDMQRALEYLDRALYYDNTLSRVYVMSQVLRNKSLKDVNNSEPSYYNVDAVIRPAGKLLVQTDKFLDLELDIPWPYRKESLDVGILAPYGFGILGEVQDVSFEGLGLQQIASVKLRLEGKRASAVNLGKPWKVNLVLVDVLSGDYTNIFIPVDVFRDPGEEGRILFVITEDLEQSTDQVHSDKTPELEELDLREVLVDLVEKAQIADNIALKTGAKWSHIVDIGSTFLRFNWLNQTTDDPAWQSVSDKYRNWIRGSLKLGNDVQLHIHGYNIPGNQYFRQYFDAASGTIRFRENLPRQRDPLGSHYSWAHNFLDWDPVSSQSSRNGSITRGVKLLEDELRSINPDYRIIFFRAGEYEFGDGPVDTRKSIQALRAAGILAGSDAFEGQLFNRSFRFHKRIGNNAYFSRKDDIRRPARDLLDIGILEIVPVPTRNGRNYLKPTDSSEDVAFSYRNSMDGDRVKSGLFILLEMFHLHNVNAGLRWDELDPEKGDWALISRQMEQVRARFPKIEFATISEAVEEYYDRYSPDLVAVRKEGRNVAEGVYEYDIFFLGRDIEVSGKYPHHVSVKPPSYFAGKVKRVELQRSGNVVESWSDPSGFENLAFTAVDRDGYLMRVYLNNPK